jgi:hypothetical protein
VVAPKMVRENNPEVLQMSLVLAFQATGGSATPTKCTRVPDIWWLERGHNPSGIGTEHTATERTCQQIEILFQRQVFKGVS